MTSLYLSYLLRDPNSKYSPFLRSRGVRTSAYESGRGTIQPVTANQWNCSSILILSLVPKCVSGTCIAIPNRDCQEMDFLLRKKYRSLLGSGQWHESNLEGITLTGSGAPGRLLKLSEPREVHTGKSLTLCHPWRMRLLRFCVHLEQPPPLAVC